MQYKIQTPEEVLRYTSLLKPEPDRIALTNLVDVMAGPFKFDSRNGETDNIDSVVADFHHYLGKQPNHLVIDMVKDKTGKYDYRVSIYIDRKTFKRKG